MNEKLDVVEISGQFWLAWVGPEGVKPISGPYSERHWAVSAHRLREIEDFPSDDFKG